MCKVEGCNRKSMYKEQDVCQKHYFRYMRNGTYEKIKKRADRLENPAGYQLLYIPGHKLAQAGGYVYEHRKVAYDKYGENLPDCELCGVECSWDKYTTHIDHIDKNVRNNSPENLRPLCNACNSRRDKSPEHERRTNYAIEFNGVTMTPTEWSRVKGCSVVGQTILRRINSGWSAIDAIYKPSKTIKKKAIEND